MRTFQPDRTDFEKSPFTGMTRKSWIEAGKYLLSGMFDNLSGIDAPPVMPRNETEITYPHLSAPEKKQEAERKAEIFEGLTRSFFIASVLLREEPGLTLNGIFVLEYYRRHIIKCCSKEDPCYVGTYEDMQELAGHADPFQPFQQTVETCALVIGLWASKEVLWDTCSPEEKKAVTDLLYDYAHANTVPQNWRFFNMLDLAFLAMEGIPVDENIMLEHASAVLAYYTGDGWYRDGQCFDYYSCWAFQFYAPLWCRWWGYEHAPEIASCFEKNSNELMKTYGRFFDRDGFVNMWGRSCIYRFAAAGAFEGNLFLKNPEVNCGWARRISSGALLQFLTRDDFLINGIPSLGFYGQFGPMVQGYSCAESPFWLGKAFLCLHLKEDHPFWTETENEGDWESIPAKGILETTLAGPGLSMTNHSANSSTILRTGKVVREEGDRHGIRNYAKLSYHTKYPWEAGLFTEGKKREDVESMQYVLHDLTKDHYLYGNAVFWAGEKDGVLYRRVFFDYTLKKETHWIQAMNLADFPLPLGILRVDRQRFCTRPVELTLGAFGFPDNGTKIGRRKKGGAQAVILTGTDHMGRKKQLAMTVFAGLEEPEALHSKGSNPDSEDSLILYAKQRLLRQYDASEPCLYVSSVITREDWTPFTEEELFPILRIEYADRYQTGAYGPVKILLKDGTLRIVDFDGIEGRLAL